MGSVSASQPTGWSGPDVGCLDNPVLLCGHCHRLIHRGDWEITFGPTDMPGWSRRDGSTRTENRCRPFTGAHE